MTFSNRLQEFMRRKHISKELLAETMDIPVETVENWLHSRSEPKAHEVLQICDILDVTTEDLYAGTHSGQSLKEVEPFSGFSYGSIILNIIIIGSIVSAVTLSIHDNVLISIIVLIGFILLAFLLAHLLKMYHHHKAKD